MSMNNHATAHYKIITDSGGSRYRFFCDLSGMALCTTEPVRGDTQQQELKMAWETEGKKHFNRCAKCGRWVSDPMFNADMLQCVDCAPWQEKPNYCIHCGKEISGTDRFCDACGTRLRYREVAV